MVAVEAERLLAEAILRLLRLAEAIERPPEALAELCCK